MMTDAKSQTPIRLYVAGRGSNSTLALDNLRQIFRRHLHGDLQFEVIDITQTPERAMADQVLYTPMLVVGSGEDEQRFLGNLTSDRAVIQALIRVGADWSESCRSES